MVTVAALRTSVRYWTNRVNQAIDACTARGLPVTGGIATHEYGAASRTRTDMLSAAWEEIK